MSSQSSGLLANLSCQSTSTYYYDPPSLLWIPWLQRPGMTLRRIKRDSRELDNASLRSQIRAYWQRLRLFPLLKKVLRSQASTLPLSRCSNLVSSSNAELVRVTRPPDSTYIIPSATGIHPDSMLRSSAGTSERGSLTITTTTYLRHSRPEPIRRSLITTYHDPVARVPSGTDLTRNLTPSSVPTSAEFELPSIGLIDMRITDSPISLRIGENSITGEMGNQALTPSSERTYAPTYSTMFSQYSFPTLPVYRAQEDDRVSMVSRAPTYRSRRSTRPSRIPFRSSSTKS